MCELILDYWKERCLTDIEFKNTFNFKGIVDVNKICTKDIFEYSPSGELSMIYFWAMDAMLYQSEVKGKTTDQIKEELILKYL
jgi:hypothetical protein